MIKIEDYEIFKNNLSTLKETSKSSPDGDSGNLNWQKKLKEKIPNWKYIDASVRTFDKSLFNTNMVVLNTNSMNHSLFYFVMDNVSKNIKIHFVSKTNIEECISDIYIVR